MRPRARGARIHPGHWCHTCTSYPASCSCGCRGRAQRPPRRVRALVLRSCLCIPCVRADRLQSAQECPTRSSDQRERNQLCRRRLAARALSPGENSWQPRQSRLKDRPVCRLNRSGSGVRATNPRRMTRPLSARVIGEHCRAEYNQLHRSSRCRRLHPDRRQRRNRCILTAQRPRPSIRPRNTKKPKGRTPRR